MKLSTRDGPLGEGSCALSAHPLACAGCWVSQGLSQGAPETGCGQACPYPLRVISGTEVGASDGIKGVWRTAPTSAWWAGPASHIPAHFHLVLTQE